MLWATVACTLWVGAADPASAFSPIDGGAAIGAVDGDASRAPHRDADVARFLAGLPSDETSALFALQSSQAWKEHAAQLDASWAKLDESRLSKMARWAQAELAPRIQPKLPVVYLFGGPDQISAEVLYPDAPRYVLCGLERVGNVPPIESLAAAELERGLSGLRTSLRTTVDLSFFITTDMSRELQKTQIRGVLPVLYLFLARNGDHVLSTEAVYLDPGGELKVAAGKVPEKGVPGWRIRFSRGGASPVKELDYFALDLTNDALPSRPGFFPFLVKLGPVNGLLKAASYILHDKRFSISRSYLLENSASILEDDSGIPFQYFAKGPWDLVFYGDYSAATSRFKDHYQPDMKKAWEQGSPRELPFTIGYRHVRGSHLLLAIARRP